MWPKIFKKEREKEWKVSGQSPVRMVFQVPAPEDRSSLSHPWRQAGGRQLVARGTKWQLRAGNMSEARLWQVEAKHLCMPGPSFVLITCWHGLCMLSLCVILIKRISSEQSSCCVSCQPISTHRMSAMETLSVGTTNGLPISLAHLHLPPNPP